MGVGWGGTPDSPRLAEAVTRSSQKLQMAERGPWRYTFVTGSQDQWRHENVRGMKFR